MNGIPWSKPLLAEFRNLACLTEDESLTLEDWAVGKSVTSTSMRLCMSTRKVDYLRRSIREKYDAVQPYSSTLPKRRPHL